MTADDVIDDDRAQLDGSAPVDVAAGPAVVVRLLGTVDALDADGSSVSFEKSKALELLAWMVTHRQHSTRQGARAALWELEVRDATFANVVSDARRALARQVPPPDGDEWVRRTMNEHLVLHLSLIHI